MSTTTALFSIFLKKAGESCFMFYVICIIKVQCQHFMISIYYNFICKLQLQSPFKSSILGKKSCAVASIIRDICSKTFVFWFHEISKLVTKTKKIELILNAEFERVFYWKFYPEGKITKSLVQFHASKGGK